MSNNKEGSLINTIFKWAIPTRSTRSNKSPSKSNSTRSNKSSSIIENLKKYIDNYKNAVKTRKAAKKKRKEEDAAEIIRKEEEAAELERQKESEIKRQEEESDLKWILPEIEKRKHKSVELDDIELELPRRTNESAKRKPNVTSKSLKEFTITDDENKKTPYYVNALIGSGGIGTVYSCSDNVCDNFLVKFEKRYNSNFISNEIQILKKLLNSDTECNKYILCIKNHGKYHSDSYNTKYNGNTVIIYDYLHDYITLSDFKNLNSDPNINIKIVDNLIKGMKYMHTKGVYHKDVKPKNIMCNPKNGDIKYIDWGASCSLYYEGAKNTNCDDTFGSPQYKYIGHYPKNSEYYETSDWYSLCISITIDAFDHIEDKFNLKMDNLDRLVTDLFEGKATTNHLLQNNLIGEGRKTSMDRILNNKNNKNNILNKKTIYDIVKNIVNSNIEIYLIDIKDRIVIDTLNFLKKHNYNFSYDYTKYTPESKLEYTHSIIKNIQYNP